MIKQGDILSGIYEILQEIGKGGVGVIYLGYHHRLQKKIVIKKVKDNYVGKLNERGEVDILKNLHHTYLPQVYDFIQIDHQIFTVMDYIEGKSLDYYLKEGHLFTEKQVLFWTNQLCDVIGYLHHQKIPIIHGDIKPANIMVRPDGDICLIDFNVSFDEERSENLSGYTARYASPEQVMKHQLYKMRKDYRSIVIDTRSDIYSLCATLYHVVTGTKPPIDWQTIKPLSTLKFPYSENLLRIIQKGMNPSLEKRYQNIDQMKYDLLNIKKNDVAYRRVIFWQKAIGTIGGIFILLGTIACCIGYRTTLADNFESEYQKMVSLAEMDEYDSVTAKGIELLSDSKYKNVMKINENKKADIFYMIANCYFEQDDYTNAVTFYQQAIENNKENSEYFRDYAIALARKKELDEATEILNQAIDLGLEEDHICLVQAEIALAEADGKTAVEKFKRAISLTENEYLQSRAYILCGRAYRQLGDLYGEITVLEEARNRVEASKLPVVNRVLGAAYMRYVGQITEKTEKDSYVNKAIECYEILMKEQQSTFNDQMNLAVLYEMTGRYQKETELLTSMESTYSEDYRVYMRYALMYFSVESQKEETERDYSIVIKYYSIAEKYYGGIQNSGASDDNMQYLEELIGELESKGWL